MNIFNFFKTRQRIIDELHFQESRIRGQRVVINKLTELLAEAEGKAQKYLISFNDLDKQYQKLKNKKKQ